MSPQDAFQREMEIVKKSKDSVDERRAKDQAAAKVPYFIRKALGDVFHEISHADLVYACKALMDIDEENGKSWHARTSKKETRARIKRACKFLRAYYKNKALEDKDETCKATIAARDEELAVCKEQLKKKEELMAAMEREVEQIVGEDQLKQLKFKIRFEHLKKTKTVDEVWAELPEENKNVLLDMMIAKQASKGKPLAGVN